jgi:hypothetical protein
VFGVAFIGAVFVFGQNLRVNSTNVYSLSVQKADGTDETAVDTYFNAYHSGTKPWNIRLTDGYAYAGAAFTYFNTYGTALAASDYHYRVSSGDGLSVGLKPASNFENGYLLASGKKEGCGTIETKDLVLTAAQQSGTVVNGTGYDFPYLALVSDSYIVVLSDIKAGETVDLAKEAGSGRVLYSNDMDYWDDIYYSLVGWGYGNTGVATDQEMAAALYIGATEAKKQVTTGTGKILVAGCVRDFDKAVSSKCKEISYGCLYTIAEQEVSNAAD